MNSKPVFLIIDLFCGAGGFTEGADQKKFIGTSVEVNTAKALITALGSSFIKTTISK